MSTATLTFGQLHPFMRVDLETGQVPALLGPPGIGKSSLVAALAREFQTKVFSLQVNQLADRADLTGVRAVEDPDTKEWKQIMFPHATIADAIAYANANPNETPILFLDEFNRATSDITSSCLSLITERCIGHHYLPKNLLLVVAGNDKGNVTGVDQASTSRFSIYHVMPDLPTFLAVNADLNPFIKEVLNQNPADLMAEDMQAAVAATSGDPDDDQNQDMQLFAFDDEESFKQITCPRTITSLSNWMNGLGLNKSGSDKEREFLASQFANIGANETIPFLAAIHAKVGMTTFAHNVYAKLHEYSNQLLSNSFAASARVLENIRPDQSLVNSLARAQDLTVVDQLAQKYLSDFGDVKMAESVIWLLEQANLQEVNNTQAAEAYVSAGLQHIPDLTPVSGSLMQIMAQRDKIAKPTLTCLAQSPAACVGPYKPFLNTTMN